MTILARHVDGADKEALFAAAALFAMTSLSENFGLAAFEAMRRGLPVLATPDVGMSEIVREVGAGLVVDPSPTASRAGLNALLADAGASRAMGESGRAACDRQLRLGVGRTADGRALPLGLAGATKRRAGK